jgi:hypothetical protein
MFKPTAPLCWLPCSAHLPSHDGVLLQQQLQLSNLPPHIPGELLQAQTRPAKIIMLWVPDKALLQGQLLLPGPSVN